MFTRGQFSPARSAGPRSTLFRTRERLAVFAVFVSFALIAAPAVAAPRGPTAADEWQAYLDAHAQSLVIDKDAVAAEVVRDGYSATPGIATLAAEGTNHSWAKLVLLLGGFPVSENNVTVFTRWMRQENGPDDWWNRNNPLNNGWGSGGGGGTGTYDNLIIAAENAAEALRTYPPYAGIVAAFDADGPTAATEAAIWASPWATGHYANGGHWSYAPVPVIKSPAGTWG